MAEPFCFQTVRGVAILHPNLRVKSSGELTFGISLLLVDIKNIFKKDTKSQTQTLRVSKYISVEYGLTAAFAYDPKLLTARRNQLTTSTVLSSKTSSVCCMTLYTKTCFLYEVDNNRFF